MNVIEDNDNYNMREYLEIWVKKKEKYFQRAWVLAAGESIVNRLDSQSIGPDW